MDDVHRLSEELSGKETLLEQYMSDAHEQSLQIVSLTAAMQDTVVSQGRKRSPPGAASPALQLSNRYEALSQIGDALGGA